MTREELHALVWSKPMRIAAKERSISDVALAKQCRKASVPVPPRGYWNKVQAGKHVTPQPLPLLQADRLNGLFPAYRTGFVPRQGGDAQRPEFESIDEVARRIASLVGRVQVPSRLVNPHPIVARLLRQDEERRAKVSPNHFSYDYYGPKFDRPIQQRRLRILSALISALERLGLKVHGSTHAGERFTVMFQRGLFVYILLAVENGPHGDPFYRDRGRSRRAPGERLRFDITGHSPEHEPPTRTWRDGDTALEAQLGEIACGILLKAEDDMRRSAVWSYEYEVKERARKAEEARVAMERAEAERIARAAAAAKARFAALVDGADALERAERIRRYVAAVRERVAAGPTEPDSDLLERWSAWALSEADALDPVLSGRFVADLQAHAEPS